MKTVVIYRLGSLGDTVVALPFFNRIAELYPDHRRVVLTNVPVSSKAAPLLSVLGEGGPVHAAIAYPVGTRDPRQLLALRRTLKSLRAQDMIYLMPTRSRLALMRDRLFLKTCGFERLIGLPWRDTDRVAQRDPHGQHVEYEVERLARALRPLGPIDLDDPRFWDLHLTGDELAAGREAVGALGSSPFIVINMGGKDASKDWGEANWTRVLAVLAARWSGHGLVIVGAGEDSARARRVTVAWPGPVVDLCGAVSPRVSAAAMRGASLFVGHDSGPLHLASAVGVPCVGLFGSFNQPHKWHPYLGDNRIIHDMRGTGAITVAQVAASCDELLGEDKA